MPSAGYGEIEIGLHRSQPETYEVELRVTDPGTDAEVAPARGQARLSLDELARLWDQPDDYGARLADGLFADTAIRDFWLKNTASFESRGLMLRLRILIGLSAPELHGLRWELLRDPDTKLPLATSERILAAGNSEILTYRDKDGKRLFVETAMMWLCGGKQKTCRILVSDRPTDYVRKQGGALKDFLEYFGKDYFSKAGYTVEPVQDHLTGLNGAGVVVIWNAWGDFTPGEMVAIRDFVDKGGGLLAVGNGAFWWGNGRKPGQAIEEYPMNRLLPGSEQVGPTKHYIENNRAGSPIREPPQVFPLRRSIQKPGRNPFQAALSW